MLFFYHREENRKITENKGAWGAEQKKVNFTEIAMEINDHRNAFFKYFLFPSSSFFFRGKAGDRERAQV